MQYIVVSDQFNIYVGTDLFEVTPHLQIPFSTFICPVVALLVMPLDTVYAITPTSCCKQS
jgi:hypothetical protein